MDCVVVPRYKVMHEILCPELLGANRSADFVNEESYVQKILELHMEIRNILLMKQCSSPGQ